METASEFIRNWIEQFMREYLSYLPGKRLNDNILFVYIDGKNIYDITKLNVRNIMNFLKI